MCLFIVYYVHSIDKSVHFNAVVQTPPVPLGILWKSERFLHVFVGLIVNVSTCFIFNFIGLVKAMVSLLREIHSFLLLKIVSGIIG